MYPGVEWRVYAFVDADKNDLDGAKTYKVTLPKGIPEGNFWSRNAATLQPAGAVLRKGVAAK